MTDILELDLQLFADDGNNSSNEDTGSNSAEDTQAQKQEETSSGDGEQKSDEYENSTEDPFDNGISDEVKKLVAQENHVDLEEAKNNSPSDTSDSEPPDYKKLYEDMKRKYEGEAQQETQTISQTAGKNLNTNTTAGNVQNSSIPNMLANIKLTPEMSSAIEEMAYNRALQISGMNKDDVEALEYAEDGDANKTRFENAKTIARNSVLSDLNTRYFQLEQIRQRRIYEQQQSAADIQDFVKEIKSVDNYQDVVDYVTKDYINTLPQLQQNAIRQAYSNADKGVSSIQDNMILRGFWNRGMSAYQKANKTADSSRAKADKINQNMTQRNKFPRVGQISNSSGSKNELWTIDRCEQLINSGQLEKIPQNIKEQLMRGYLE